MKLHQAATGAKLKIGNLRHTVALREPLALIAGVQKDHLGFPNEILLTFTNHQLDKKDCFGNWDPFFRNL